MKVLVYNEIDTHKVQKPYAKIIAFLVAVLVAFNSLLMTKLGCLFKGIFYFTHGTVN